MRALADKSKYRVRLSQKAEADVESVLRWFQDQHATIAGERWFRRLMAAVKTLETHPERCVIADESEELSVEIRHLLFGKRNSIYRILFRLEKRTVIVLRVWHGARDRLASDELPKE